MARTEADKTKEGLKVTEREMVMAEGYLFFSTKQARAMDVVAKETPGTLRRNKVMARIKGKPLKDAKRYTQLYSPGGRDLAWFRTAHKKAWSDSRYVGFGKFLRMDA